MTMDDHFLCVRVIYEDLPDLIELSVRVVHGAWSAQSTAYTSPEFFTDSEKLLHWVEAPDEPFRIEAGADTGIGWMALQFYKIDSAGHARCAVTLATRASSKLRPAETSRFAIELPTELGLIERFAREITALRSNSSLAARLVCLPAP
jgi:hypothetical protein